MRASGKDCRANEDKDSPLCSARKKFNCRGKNEEKKSGMGKSEKLYKFLKKKDKKDDEDLEKSRLATKQTTKPVPQKHAEEGTIRGYKQKEFDKETGKAKWTDISRGKTKAADGSIETPEGNSPMSVPRPKQQKLEKL